MAAVLRSLRNGKTARWAFAYLTGAWAVLEIADVLGDMFGWPVTLYRALVVVLAYGVFITLALAWYHGEKGERRVRAPELVIIAAVLGACAVTVKALSAERSGPGTPGDAGEESATASLAVPLRAVLYDNPSIAILPLKNLGGEEDDVFVEGLHDDILSALQKIGGLTVISRTSVQKYRDRAMLLPEIAKELRVDAVGEGTVSRRGDRIRVNVQLIDGARDSHLWSEQYDRELTAANLFAIRSEIARSVARAMSATLTSEEDARLDASPVGSLTAYDWVQIARSRCSGCEERGEAYREAVEADSTYAPAWAGLASNYAVRVLNFGAPALLADSALIFANRALELDPELAAAYGAKGTAYYAGRGQSGLALEYHRRAALLEPGNSAGWAHVGVFSAVRGRWVEALDADWRALRSRPTSAWVRGNMAELYAALGMNERAQQVLDEAARIDPTDETVLHYRSYAEAMRGNVAAASALAEETVDRYPEARNHQWAALLAGRMGDLDAARRHAEAARALAPEGMSLESNVRSVPVTLGFALQRAGEAEAAERLFASALDQLYARLEDGADDGYLRVDISAIAAAKGRSGEAARWMTAAFDAGFRYYREVELDPVFDSVREAPAFEEVMARMRADVGEMARQIAQQEAELERDRRR